MSDDTKAVLIAVHIIGVVVAMFAFGGWRLGLGGCTLYVAVLAGLMLRAGGCSRRTTTLRH